MEEPSRRGALRYLPVLTEPKFTKCRWSCGDQCAHTPPNRSDNETLASVVERAYSRRRFLQASAGALVLLGAATAPDRAAAATATRSADGDPLGFTPIRPNREDRVVVPRGYEAGITIRWGDPILEDAPDFDFDRQTPEAQAGQFGYNNDFLAFMPLDEGKDAGLLFSNHEYTNPELMFRHYNPDRPTAAQVGVEWAAHGLSVVQVERDGQAGYTYVRGSRFNRRFTATTPFELRGPAAGSKWTKTAADPDGRTVLGTLNNCAGGVTPWGTVLSGEENFHQYFANSSQVTNPNIARVHARYGVEEAATDRKWERFDERFDTAKHPTEPFRFGWVVEVDPYDPDSTPVKHTALGRMKHEGATTAVGKDGRVAVYTGDDEVFEYFYKFVSAGSFREGDREHNRTLLDEGTLYVAKLDADAAGNLVGRWLPLVHGKGPLTPANGFHSQADVLVNTRGAADLLGATKMDRPEDIERNPVNGAVYVALTNNDERTRAQTDRANPRGPNNFGHVIELREDGDDPAAETFTWELFLVCGDPADPSTYFAGFPKSQVSPIGSPDNVAFDNRGNLWLATDGAQPRGTHNGFFACPTDGEQRGHVQLFLTVPRGAEACGPVLNPDNTAIFCAVQHPGEDGTLTAPVSRWPDGAEPRPSVVTVWKAAGEDRTIGR
jgi:uncharacterized protein